MELCVKTLGHWATVLSMWVSNIYLWMLDANGIQFLDSSMKYITFAMGVLSAIIYITLTILKKQKERKEIQRIELEIETSRIDNKIKIQQLIEMQNKNKES